MDAGQGLCRVVVHVALHSCGTASRCPSVSEFSQSRRARGVIRWLRSLAWLVFLNCLSHGLWLTPRLHVIFYQILIYRLATG